MPTPSTNFSVVRVKRDILRRSSVGAILTNAVGGAERVRIEPGLWRLMARFAFFSNLSSTRTGRRPGPRASTATTPATARRSTTPATVTACSSNGWRSATTSIPKSASCAATTCGASFGQFRFSPRPASIPSVRKFSWHRAPSTTSRTARACWRRATVDGEFAIEFQNSDRFSVGITDNYELLHAAVRHRARRARSRSASTTSRRHAWRITFGQQRPLSGNVAVEHGRFYDGHLTSAGFNRGRRVNVTARFSLEPTVSINWIDLPTGSFTAKLVGSRVTYTMTPLMFVSALRPVQLEHQPGERERAAAVGVSAGQRAVRRLQRRARQPHARFPDLQNRAFIVKVNRLFRF